MGHAALRPACGKTIRAHVMQTKICLKLIGFSGEPDRIRTCDPLIKSQLLYQLSYGPTSQGGLLGVGPGGVKRKNRCLWQNLFGKRM